MSTTAPIQQASAAPQASQPLSQKKNEYVFSKFIKERKRR